VAVLTDRTPGGTLAYCDYLTDKGYATAAQINPWRTAVQRVFETVEGEGWESLDLTSIDFDEYLARFQTLAGAQYKAESITAYKRRIRNALDAHEHYLENGRPPTFRQGGKREKSEKVKAEPKPSLVTTSSSSSSTTTTPAAGMMDFPYPLGNGEVMATLRLPKRLKSDDVNRLCAFIRTLQDDSPEQRQLPHRTGDDQHAQAA
jgi:hypothetical protein